MARDFIPLGAVADRGAAMLEIRCGRSDRHGRLSVKRWLNQFGADVFMYDVMGAQVRGACLLSPLRNRTHQRTDALADLREV